MSVTSFNDAVVAAVAKGWDAAAEVETVDEIRKRRLWWVRRGFWKEETPPPPKRRRKKRRKSMSKI